MKLIKPTKINEYQETKADRIIETVFIIGLTLILLVLSVLILATTSHAASSNGLPYIVPDHLGLNSFYTESHNSYIMNNSTVQSYLSDADNYLIVPVDIGAYPQPNGYTDYYFYIYIFKNCSVTSNISDYKNFDYTTTSVTVTSSNYLRVIYQYWERQNTFYGISGQTYTNNNGYQLLGSHNTLTYNVGDFTSCYPVYNSTDIFDLNNKVIFTSNAQPFEPVSGHATEPDFDNNDNINTDGHAHQPNTPSFPSFIPPTIDTSTLETLVDSLIDTVVDFADFVGECFSVFFSWLVEVIKNVGQSLYNAIVDTANFLYNNFVSLFEPMMVNIGHAIEPVQSDEVSSAFESTQLYGLISDFTSFTSTFDNAFDVSEPDSFTITIHVENIDILNQSSPFILNLGSNFLPIRSALRTFLWILVSFASVIFIEHNLSSWLKGSGEEK